MHTCPTGNLCELPINTHAHTLTCTDVHRVLLRLTDTHSLQGVAWCVFVHITGPLFVTGRP